MEIALSGNVFLTPQNLVTHYRQQRERTNGVYTPFIYAEFGFYLRYDRQNCAFHNYVLKSLEKLNY